MSHTHGNGRSAAGNHPTDEGSIPSSSTKTTQDGTNSASLSGCESVANRLQPSYSCVVATIDDLLGRDPDTATRAAQEAVPGFVAEMDEIAPAIAAGCNRPVLLHYWMTVDGAAQRLTALPSTDPDIAERAATGYFLLRDNAAELLWTAPTVDGTGVLTALVDRIRFLVGGLPRPPRRGGAGLDRAVLHRVVVTLADIEFERRVDEPLRRVMATLALTSSDVAGMMGVTRQAVDKWLQSGTPTERLDRIGTLAEIADILRHRLREGMPAVVVRRPAEAYGGRSMLEMITDGDHRELLESVRASFDYARVA